MQEDNHMFQGLRRDNHQIKQDGNFLWDAHNIRLTNRDDSTLLSITNEKGTLNTGITFEGLYVGHCVLGKYLVLFTALENGTDNYIYRIEKEGTRYKVITLYYDEADEKGNWSPEHPIEAIGIYETELIQKVYWVDGANQPRVINIAKPELKIPEKYLVNGVNLSGRPDFSSDPDIDLYLREHIPGGLYKKGSFDFSRTLMLKETMDVHRGEGNGVFSPGTIQYACSYHNKYEQEANIAYTTPINYISPIDRGGSPEEKIANIFTIGISNPDPNFEYIRIYSIHRTSIDAVPTVKVLEDILIEGKSYIEYVDDGTKGYTIDPTQLLYIGGRSILAGCIASKDGTLFLGNIELNSQQDSFEELISGADWELSEYTLNESAQESAVSTYYDYTNPLRSGYSARFKSGEKYRFGIQVQTSDGLWSSPIYLGDEIMNTDTIISYPRQSRAIQFLDPQSLRDAGIKRVRACVVFPKTNERDVICQGILCPTVYSAYGRRIDSPYAMSSWFFRPVTKSIDNSSNVYNGASIQFEHNKPLFTGDDRGAEIQNMLSDQGITGVNSIDNSNYDRYKSYFFIDENIVTFHSPDLEFDTQLRNFDWSNVTLNIIGMAQLGAISGDIDIQTSSPTAGNASAGFIHTSIGYQTKNNKTINGGLVSGLFYESGQLDEDYNVSASRYFMVYPWNRSGSLNNDSNRPADSDSIRTAVLSKKVISNLKFFSKNASLGTTFNYNISTPILFNSNGLELVKLVPAYLNKDVPYMGNVDTLSTISSPYSFYIGTNFHTDIGVISGDSSSGKPLISSSADPVRIKYKSSPHLVFSLSGDTSNQIKLLPRHVGVGGILNVNDYTFPDWQNTGSSDGSNNNKGEYNGNLLYVDSNAFITTDYLTQGIVGNYAFDRLYGAKDNVYTIGLGKIDAYGKIYWDYKGHDGKILRLLKNFTSSKRTHGNLLPGTTDADWSGVRYIGETKYYKVVEGEPSASGTPNYSLEEVQVSSRALSRAGNILFSINQESFGESTDSVPPYLLLAELIRVVPDEIKFGGTSDEAKRQNLWLPAGRIVDITEAQTADDFILVPIEYGDTWYSRYDCLKTYPFTREDENQVVEIGSFMCETRVNIDGRYDRNRGQLSNINMTPQNFNLINEVYSQKDDFFNYRILDKDYYKQNKFSNQITWSKEKSSGEDIDTWTNITLANTLDMDGEKGKVTAIRTWNENLLCFQEKALSQILFNSRVQIPVTDGVPIEVSNGYKVDGSRLLSGNIGCTNKWSIIPTTTGVYFLDSNTDSLYLFNGQLANLSEARGMSWWTRQNHTNSIWSPVDSESLNGIRSFYDNRFGDIYFSPGPTTLSQPDALCYSEQLGQFTSFMSYGGVQAMFNYADGFYSIKHINGRVRLFQNNAGNYNNFYGNSEGWSFSFISNQNPTITKIFDTIELRTDHYSGDTLLDTFPMKYLKISNEYQNGEAHFNEKNMRKKFRVWRGLLPRHERTMQRIRNPWAMITLGWEPTDATSNNRRAVIHDVSVKYTV